MKRFAISLFVFLFAASAIAAPCPHRLETPVDAAAWASVVLAVADFDGDRVTDVVLRDDGAPAVRLLRRDGSTIDFPLPIGGDVRGVAIGDFDGDGRPDIALTSFDFKGYIAMNRLPAGFEVEPLPQANGFARPLAADFDQDGKVDLMMVGGGQPRLLYGDGSGRFPESLATGIIGTVPAAIVDWNGDGFMDLVLARSSNRFAVHLNENGRSFRAGGTVDVDGHTNEILVGDVTGDGHPDLVALTSTAIAIADGSGDGFAEPRAKIMAHATAEGAVIADFDRDGRNELAFSLANRSDVIDGEVINVGPELIVSRVSADAGRNDVWTFPTRRGVHLFSGDFDGDGRLDLMAGGAVYRGSGALGFATEERVSPGFSPSFVAAGDFNGDGFADLAVASSASPVIRIYRGRAAGGLAAAGTLAIDQPKSLMVTDFDRDGRADLVIARNGELIVYYGTGTGEALLGSPVSTPVSGTPLAVTALDVTENGRPDLVFSEASGERYVLKILASDVPRGFFPFQDFDAGTKAPTAIGLADVDRNTITDLIVVSAGKVPATPPFEHDGTVVAFRRDGTRRIVTQDLLAEKLSPAAIETADWDLDGDVDLLIAQRYGPLLLLRNEGGMEFSEQVLGASSTQQMLRTDLDRDGREDILLLQTAETVLRLEHQEGELREAGGFVVGSVPVAMSAGDFNGDGVMDLAVANAGSDSVSIVYGSCGRTRPVRRR
jgi:large repetitive protein